MQKTYPKAILAIMFVLLMTIQVAGCQAKKDNNSSSTLSPTASDSSLETSPSGVFGNSMGNLYYGGGLVAEQGDYHYFISGPGRFFQQKQGESITTRFLVNEMQEGYDYGSLNVIGDWIYYVNITKNVLYKVKTDRSNQTKICDNVRMCIADNNWIYFISSGDSGIYKIKADGSQKTELMKGNSGYIDKMSISGDWIFFNRFEDENGKTVKNGTYVKTDGTNIKKSDLPNGFLYQGWIYYTVLGKEPTVTNLYRKKENGSNNEQLVENVSLFNVHEDKVYFNKGIGFNIFELDLNTKVVKQVIKNSSVGGLSYIDITGKFIFLSGQIPNSPRIDLVKTPIDSQSDKSGEERFNFGSLKWEPAK